MDDFTGSSYEFTVDVVTKAVAGVAVLTTVVDRPLDVVTGLRLDAPLECTVWASTRVAGFEPSVARTFTCEVER